MSRDKFIDWSPQPDTLALVQAAVGIGESYAQQGFRLTLRQMYYQFVARGFIPNDVRSYRRLSSIVDKARLAGMLDWSYIEDRERNTYSTDGSDTSPEDAIRSTAGGYSRELWETQPRHVEVWVEKQALSGVVSTAARATGVNYLACKGYVSQSVMYEAAQRFRYLRRMGKDCVILHLGDHDPSGIDMTRDIRERLTTFGRGYAPEVHRIALNMDQVEELNPPPNPAKEVDPRFADYEALYGSQSWELDAIEPTALNRLIVGAVLDLRDPDLWEEAHDTQERERALLTAISDRWSEVEELVS